ncbi:hypothetical protein VMCG_03278 [Cytospora schulzeri]|uniref:Uncharacterized protein n=1 Tax=Cytospora schulzeri TaxID=448051 RepID=A0A423WYD4_9PEZI|nr:hypothetical protein VMCG_03278 [Valsa malicola]
MSPIPSAVLHAKVDSGKSLPGAFPLETEQAAGNQKESRMDLLENQGKTTGIKATGASPFRAQDEQPVEDHTWLKSLDALEAQPVENTGPLERGETRYMRLSRRQLENYDDVDIMDAMERGECM